MTHGLGISLRALVRFALAGVALLLLVLVAACTSRGHRDGDEDRASLSVLRTATSLGARDARLSASLRATERGAGWTREDEHFTSPGWRTPGVATALRARLPLGAAEALEIGGGEGALRARPIGARAVNGEIAAGRVVYPSAYGEGVDLVVTASSDAVEELFVLRDERASSAFSWHVDLPKGASCRRALVDDSLRFEGVGGRLLARVSPAYAVDATGQRRDASLTWDRERSELGVRLDTRGLTYPVLLDPTFDIAVWEQVQSPPGRLYSAMAYDSYRGRIVMFGGSYNEAGQYNPFLPPTTTVGDTWLWDGSTWTNPTLLVSPPPRTQHAMAYDAAHDRVVLFGGLAGTGGGLNDTWTWDGAAWTQQTPATSPPARLAHSMAYDAARGRVVMFGGELTVAGDPAVNDTWTWDGSTWTKQTPATSPTARSGQSMAYDSVRQQVVMFGGTAGAETWLWDGVTWTEATPATSPSARSHAAMSFDAVSGSVVLFGGSVSGTNSANDTWSWNGTTWARTSPSPSPLARAFLAMAYDEARGTVILFGGMNDGYTGLADTWSWDGAAWTSVGGGATLTNPPARTNHAMAYDEATRTVVLFGGGSSLSDTWTWNGFVWTQLTPAAPPGRASHALAYDGARQRVVLFGGLAGGATLEKDTWLWNGTFWTQAAPATSPSAREGHAMAYDANHQVVVLFGGLTNLAANAAGADTWIWDGTTWSSPSPNPAPSARVNHAMAYDAAHQQIVLFGGATQNGFASDTWLWDGAAWHATTPATSPSGRTNQAMTYDASRQRVLLVGPGAGGLTETWSWDGSTWTQLTESPAPSPRTSTVIAYDEAHARTVLFSGGASQDTWLLYARGGTCTTGADCGTGFCVDGACCDAPSCGTCEACNVASSPGVCSPVVNLPDPGTCSGASSCDATGTCKPALGQMCTAGSGCASGHCVDGVCCDTACTGSCTACAMASTGKSDGTCAFTALGQDPHSECADDGASTCGHDGSCDGAGRCALYPPGASCGMSSCQLNHATGAICDGLGMCTVATASQGVDCAPAICNPETGGCANPCASDNDCLAGNFCDAGTCTARRGYGDPCTVAAGCPVGAFCADGVCCNTPCTDQCASCAEPSAKGSCIPVEGAPRNGRAACAAGSASDDVCRAATCNSVVVDSCAGFVGPTVQCRVASCTNGVATVPGSCSGKGSCEDLLTVPCTPYTCAGAVCATSCAKDTDCAVSFDCDTQTRTCVPKSGASCDGAHTVTTPDGHTQDCAPYNCSGSSCRNSCESIADCTDGTVCDAHGHCITPSDPSLASGCAVGAGGRGDAKDAEGALAWLAAIGVVLRGRRRRRGERASRPEGTGGRHSRHGDLA